MGLYSNAKAYLMGDCGLLLEFGDEISREINEKVRRMALAIQTEAMEGIVETVPTYRSLLVIYNPVILSIEGLKKRLKRIEEGLQQAPLPEPKLTHIPVVYGGMYGPDLEEVAKYHQISPKEVIQLHCSKPYLIFMVGFMPGFPYMGELPQALAIPRLKTPRLSVPKGSVAIAQRQTGIYSMESPGGWQILGRTPVELFDPEQDPPALLQMGDFVQFYPIDEEEFKEWRTQETTSRFISPPHGGGDEGEGENIWGHPHPTPLPSRGRGDLLKEFRKWEKLQLLKS